jgi:hypothetical protein
MKESWRDYGDDDEGPWIDWMADDEVDSGEMIVPGFLACGCWTLIAARTKEGKSTIALHVALSLARGLDPWSGESISPMVVAYFDAEMGRQEVLERIDATGLNRSDLVGWLCYTDQARSLDIPQAASEMLDALQRVKAQVVVFDGLNGFVSGEENAADPWRDLYGIMIAPLKARGVAVLALDNMGKAVSKGPRGSSAKQDKVDVVFTTTRSAQGAVLKRLVSRSAKFHAEIELTSVVNEFDELVGFTVNDDYPAGTLEAVTRLDGIGVADGTSQRDTRRLLKARGERMEQRIMVAALRYKRHRNTSVSPPYHASTSSDTDEGAEIRIAAGISQFVSQRIGTPGDCVPGPLSIEGPVRSPTPPADFEDVLGLFDTEES